MSEKDARLLHDIATRIKEARTMRGMTQNELSQKLHKSKQMVSAWETARSEILVSDMLKICNILSVELPWLVLGQPSVGENPKATLGKVVPYASAGELGTWARRKSGDLRAELHIQVHVNVSERALALANPDEGATTVTSALVKGQTIIVDPELKLSPGDLCACIVYHDDGKELAEPVCVLRKIKFLSTNIGEAPFELVPLNDSWSTITVRKPSHVRVMGKLAASVRTYV